jgi:hypothetical protein
MSNKKKQDLNDNINLIHIAINNYLDDCHIDIEKDFLKNVLSKELIEYLHYENIDIQNIKIKPIYTKKFTTSQQNNLQDEYINDPEFFSIKYIDNQSVIHIIDKYEKKHIFFLDLQSPTSSS